MAMPMSAYERRRQANIADNKRVLAALGLLNPENDRPTLELILNLKNQKPDSTKEPPKKRVKKEKVVLSEVSDNAELGSITGFVRRSARRQGKAVAETNISLNEEEFDADENDQPTRSKVPPNREKFYGPVPDVEIGASYMTRMEFCRVNVHRPTVAGIHGGPDGAYSIALSGGYEDDIDRGEFFTYTGEGGRDLKGTVNKPKNLRTAAQSKDQTLTRGNLALKRNVETGNPVRVIRGYKLKSPYAPEEGYRYDGLYNVEKAWFTAGLSGFGVWKFAMKRCENQPPPPWKYLDGIPDEPMTEVKPDEPQVAALPRKRKISEVSSSSDSDSEDEGNKSKSEELSASNVVTSDDAKVKTELDGDDIAVENVPIIYNGKYNKCTIMNNGKTDKSAPEQPIKETVLKANEPRRQNSNSAGKDSAQKITEEEPLQNSEKSAGPMSNTPASEVAEPEQDESKTVPQQPTAESEEAEKETQENADSVSAENTEPVNVGEQKGDVENDTNDDFGLENAGETVDRASENRVLARDFKNVERPAELVSAPPAD